MQQNYGGGGADSVSGQIAAAIEDVKTWLCLMDTPNEKCYVLDWPHGHEVFGLLIKGFLEIIYGIYILVSKTFHAESLASKRL